MATQTSIFMEKEELKEGLIECQIQINFPCLIARAISYWEHNTDGAVSSSCWLITWSEGRSKEARGGGGCSDMWASLAKQERRGLDVWL